MHTKYAHYTFGVKILEHLDDELKNYKNKDIKNGGK